MACREAVPTAGVATEVIEHSVVGIPILGSHD